MGKGIFATKRNKDEIIEVAKCSDRWLFSADQELHALNAKRLTDAQVLDPETLQLPESYMSGPSVLVPEVPLGFIGEDWSKVDSSPWSRVEPIPVLEGRAFVWLGQHLARSQKNLGKHHLILTDSMSACLALAKGR